MLTGKTGVSFVTLNEMFEKEEGKAMWGMSGTYKRMARFLDANGDGKLDTGENGAGRRQSQRKYIEQFCSIDFFYLPKVANVSRISLADMGGGLVGYFQIYHMAFNKPHSFQPAGRNSGGKISARVLNNCPNLMNVGPSSSQSKRRRCGLLA